MMKQTNHPKRHLVMTAQQWSLGHSYNDCLRLLRLKETTKKPHVHFEFTHDNWEWFPLIGEWHPIDPDKEWSRPIVREINF